MNESQQLRESLWDLVYGLVSPEDEQQLIDRIKSDPVVARLYAEVRLEADLVGQAAKVEDSSLVLRGTAAERIAPVAPPAKPPVSLPAKKTASRAVAAPLVMAVMATALLVLLAVGLMWPTGSAQLVAHNLLAIDVLSDPSLPAGLTRKVELRTYAVSGSGDFAPTRAEIDVRLAAADGRELMRRAVKTDATGQASVEIPGSVIEPGARVEVSASGSRMARTRASGREGRPVVAELTVEPEPQMAYFLVSEPMVEEGKPVEVSLWNFAAFSTKPAPAETAQAAMDEFEGLNVQQAEASATQPGVLNALVQVDQPRTEPPQAKEIVEDQRREAQASQSAERLAAAPRTSSNLPAEARSARSNTQAGLRGRQYTQGFDRGLQRARVSQNRSGSAAPQLRGGGFGDVGQTRIDDAEVTTVAAGQPIKMPIPASLIGKEVVATAVCRGATVATAFHHPPAASASNATKLESAQASSAEIVLDLPPEADGMIEVSLYERTSQEPMLALQRQVYRQPLKQLQITVAKQKARFAPGEQVDLALRVTDEAGRPAANARLGVRVWNELSLQQAEQQPVLLADAVRSGTLAIAAEEQQQAAVPRSGYDAGGALANSAEPADRAAAAEGKAIAGKDLALADQVSPGQSKLARADGDKLPRPDDAEALSRVEPVKQFVESAGEAINETTWFSQPIELASNRAAIQQAVRSAAEQADERRSQVRFTIGMIVLAGGIVLLIAVAASAAKRMIRIPLVVPAGAIGLACVLIGALWSGRAFLLQHDGAVATAQPATTSAEATTAAPPAADLAKASEPAPAASAAAGAAPPANAGVLAEPAASAPASPPVDASAFVLDAKRAQQSAGSPQAEPQATPSLAAGAPAAPQAAGRAALARGLVENGAKNEQTAPAAIYFNPQLVTDAEGRANIQFVMPAVESEYRVLIDALGQGRIGSQQEQLIIDPALEKTPAPAK